MANATPCPMAIGDMAARLRTLVEEGVLKISYQSRSFSIFASFRSQFSPR